MGPGPRARSRLGGRLRARARRRAAWPARRGMLCTLEPKKIKKKVSAAAACLLLAKDALEERLVGTLGGDHAVGNGGVCDFGTVILIVGVWFAFDVRDPGHGGGSLLSRYSR